MAKGEQTEKRTADVVHRCCDADDSQVVIRNRRRARPPHLPRGLGRLDNGSNTLSALKTVGTKKGRPVVGGVGCSFLRRGREDKWSADLLSLGGDHQEAENPLLETKGQLQPMPSLWDSNWHRCSSQVAMKRFQDDVLRASNLSAK